METKKPLIACIGELVWDLLPGGKQIGGAPCNFAFHAQQAGCDSQIISAVGADDLGVEMVNTIKDLGLNTRLIQTNQFPTGSVGVALQEDGQPIFTIHEQVAWDAISPNEHSLNLARNADAISFGSLAQREGESKRTIQRLLNETHSDCLKVFDINLRQHFYTSETILDSIERADILKLSEEELPVVASFDALTGTISEQLNQLLLKRDLKYILYTLGSKGSIIIGRDEYSFLDAPKVKVADTVGAGDAFAAVFTAGLLLGKPLSVIHREATEIAAWVCSQKGATPYWPGTKH